MQGKSDRIYTRRYEVQALRLFILMGLVFFMARECRNDMSPYRECMEKTGNFQYCGRGYGR